MPEEKACHPIQSWLPNGISKRLSADTLKLNTSSDFAITRAKVCAETTPKL